MGYTQKNGVQNSLQDFDQKLNVLQNKKNEFFTISATHGNRVDEVTNIHLHIWIIHLVFLFDYSQQLGPFHIRSTEFCEFVFKIKKKCSVFQSEICSIILFGSKGFLNVFIKIVFTLNVNCLVPIVE